MAEDRRPQLRIDSQRFAQEVAEEIAADLRRQKAPQVAQPVEPSQVQEGDPLRRL